MYSEVGVHHAFLQANMQNRKDLLVKKSGDECEDRTNICYQLGNRNLRPLLVLVSQLPKFLLVLKDISPNFIQIGSATEEDKRVSR